MNGSRIKSGYLIASLRCNCCPHLLLRQSVASFKSEASAFGLCLYADSSTLGPCTWGTKGEYEPLNLERVIPSENACADVLECRELCPLRGSKISLGPFSPAVMGWQITLRSTSLLFSLEHFDFWTPLPGDWGIAGESPLKETTALRCAGSYINWSQMREEDKQGSMEGEDADFISLEFL